MQIVEMKNFMCVVDVLHSSSFVASCRSSILLLILLGTTAEITDSSENKTSPPPSENLKTT
ncbi:unnamed protein product [Tenebrio molitor]|nr:unnamed protein product [Tenebrio molitor]